MSIIKLPAHIISRISAGEVVDRPTNIVKELIENAIDADATKISILIENGGIDLVKITDNGNGIAKDDLQIAFQLHTTSKIIDEDILNVSTLGFRGEALASIAAVCRVDCRSKREGDETGNRLIIEGGNELTFEEYNCNDGTTISVSGIFFNTPARRKFLKKPSTERKRIMSIVTSYMLMYPHINFKLEEKVNSQVKKRLESPSRKGIMSAIYDVLGPDIANDILPINGKLGDWRISGHISKPQLVRRDRNLQFICVNGRPVNHKELQESIEKAYGSQLMKSSYPVIILNITGPVNGIDFNIHPQKSEIRFKTDDNIVFEVHKLVDQTLNKTWELPKLHTRKLARVSAEPKKTPHKTTQNMDRGQPTTGQINDDSITLPKKRTINLQTSLDESIEPFERIDDDIKKEKTRQFNQMLTGGGSVVVAGKRILGHIMKKFAIIDAGEELWLMDIHASDERVKFEMYEKRKNKQIIAQQFLEAIEVEMVPMEKQMILDHKDQLDRFGLKIVDGSGNKILIYSAPIFYDRKITKDSVRDLLHGFFEVLDQSEDQIVETVFDRIEYKLVAKLACHGSIRSGYHVSTENIAKVLENLLKCKNPWTCAHGRPTILRLSHSDLENWFNR